MRVIWGKVEGGGDREYKGLFWRGMVKEGFFGEIITRTEQPREMLHGTIWEKSNSGRGHMGAKDPMQP